MSRHLTDLQLERYLSEALSPAQRLEVEAVLKQSPADVAALAELRADSEAFLVKAPPPAFAAKVVPERPQRRGLPVWFAFAAAVATAGVVAVIVAQPPDDVLQAKGPVAWRVSVTHQGQTKKLESEAVLFAEDVLSFQVTSAAPAYVAVLSRSPNGVFVYVPSRGGPALRVAAGVSLLPEGARLDAALGTEELFMLSSSHTFDVQRALVAFSENPPERWQTVEVSRLRFEKRAPE